MKRILLIMTMAFLSVSTHADERLIPDGNGGYIIRDQPDFSMFGPEGMPQVQIQKMELQKQQIENQRLQNELLRRQLEREQNAREAPQRQTPQDQAQLSAEFRSWQAANPWFGIDKPKTEFAMLYAKQLRQEHPELVGKPFFDAISAKVSDVFGISKIEHPK